MVDFSELIYLRWTDILSRTNKDLIFSFGFRKERNILRRLRIKTHKYTLVYTYTICNVSKSKSTLHTTVVSKKDRLYPSSSLKVLLQCVDDSNNKSLLFLMTIYIQGRVPHSINFYTVSYSGKNTSSFTTQGERIKNVH